MNTQAEQLAEQHMTWALNACDLVAKRYCPSPPNYQIELQDELMVTFAECCMKFNGIGNFKGYCYPLMRWRAIDWMRIQFGRPSQRKKKKPVYHCCDLIHTDDGVESEGLNALENQALNTYHQQQSTDRAHTRAQEMVMLLPIGRYRQLFQLRYIEGKSVGEICRIMDISKSRVQQITQSGLEEIRRWVA